MTRSTPSGSGTDLGYRVEARHNNYEPLQIGNKIYDKQWREIPFDEVSKGGVIPHRRFAHHMAQTYLMEYTAAQALRFQFMADIKNGSSFRGLCMETRLVKYRVESKYETFEEGSLEAIDSRHQPIEELETTPEETTP